MSENKEIHMKRKKKRERGWNRRERSPAAH
jgi:hypothetical protein